MMKKEWIKLLHRSFEEDLSEKETIQLAEALKKSPELRQEQEELVATRNLFASFSLAADSDFVLGVMNAIEEEEIVAKRQIGHYLSQVFPMAVAVCILILMSFVVHIYITEGSFDSEAIVGINDLSPDEAYSFLTEE